MTALAYRDTHFSAALGYADTTTEGSPASGGGSAFATTVAFEVIDEATGIGATGLTNLDFAFFDQPRIKDALAPVIRGSTMSIQNGMAVIDITGVTSLAPGQTGRVEWSTADGLKGGGGRVVVS